MTPAELAAALGKAERSGRAWKCLCPAHNDLKPSLSVEERGGKLLVKCHAGCEQDAVIGELKRRGLWETPAKPNGHDLKPRIVATYDYRDKDGKLKYQVVRFAPKDFRQRRPAPEGATEPWIWNMDGVESLPYRLPELLANPIAMVFVPEGEKDVDNLVKRGLVATCNHGGAKKWRAETSKWLAGRDVVVLPDNDDPGRAHAQDVLQKLHGIASRARLLNLPGLRDKEDVSDWLAHGGTVEYLEQQTALFAVEWSPSDADQAKETTPESEVAAELAGEVERLAKLSSIARELERDAVAEKFNIRVSALDRMVKTEIGKAGSGDEGASKPGQGRPIIISETEPWPEPADGAVLLSDIAAAIRTYLVLSQRQADAVALWVVFTHCFDVFDFSPRLCITSAQKRSGKSRLVDILRRLARRPYSTSGATAAALLRIIETYAPAMLLDEFDTLLKGDPEMAEALRGILNSGFNRALAQLIKCVPLPGGGYEVRGFSTWCPTLLSGIGKLPDTVADRSIIIELKRKLQDEKIRRLRERDGDDLRILGRRAARWAADNLGAIGDADPRAPGQLNDRAADTWSPLLAIADQAGGEWPKRARDAAVELTGGEEDTQTALEMLLSDLRDLFEEKQVSGLFTTEIIGALHKRDDRPWPEWGKAKRPITPVQLAAMLKSLKVTTKQTVRRGQEVAKGYNRKTLDDAFARYLPPPSGVTGLQPAESLASSDFFGVTETDLVTPENQENPSVSAGCNPVTPKTPPQGPESEWVGERASNGADFDAPIDDDDVPFDDPLPADTSDAFARYIPHPIGNIGESASLFGDPVKAPPDDDDIPFDDDAPDIVSPPKWNEDL